MAKKAPLHRPPGITEVCGSFDINAGTDREPLVVSTGRTYVPRRARKPARERAGAGVVAQMSQQIAEFAQPPLRGQPTAIARRLTTERGGVVAYLGEVPEHILAFGVAKRMSTRPFLPGRYNYVFEQFGVTSHDDLMRKRKSDPDRVSRYLAGCAAVLSCTIADMADDAYVHFPERAGTTIYGENVPDTRTGSFFRSLGCVSQPDVGPWGSGEGVLSAPVGHLRQELQRQYPFLTAPPPELPVPRSRGPLNT